MRPTSRLSIELSPLWRGDRALAKVGRAVTAAGALVMLTALAGCAVADEPAAWVYSFWVGGAIQVFGLALERRGLFGRWL